MKLFIRSIWLSSPRWLWPLLKSNHKSQPNMEDNNLYLLSLSLCACMCAHKGRCSSFLDVTVFVCGNSSVFVLVCLCEIVISFLLMLWSRDLRWSSHKMETRERQTTPCVRPKGNKHTRDQPYFFTMWHSPPCFSIGLTAVLLFCVSWPPLLSLWIM